MLLDVEMLYDLIPYALKRSDKMAGKLRKFIISASDQSIAEKNMVVGTSLLNQLVFL